MPLQGLTGGDLPWLIKRPPADALASGLHAGQGIAQQRLQQQQIKLQAAQQQEIAAHRQVQDGIQKAQEARAQTLYSRGLANNLSREMGMKDLQVGMEVFYGMNPNATPSEVAKATASLMLKHAPQIFPDGQGFVPAMQNMQKALGDIGMEEALIDWRKSSAILNRQKAQESFANETDAQLGLGKQYAPDTLTKLIAGRDRAKAEGRDDDAEDYQSRIDSEQVKQQQSATRNRVSAKLAAAKQDDAAFQKQLAGIENDLMLSLPSKKAEKAAAIAEIQKKRMESRQKYIGDLLADESTTTQAAPEQAPAAEAAPSGKQRLIFDPATGSFSPAK